MKAVDSKMRSILRFSNENDGFKSCPDGFRDQVAVDVMSVTRTLTSCPTVILAYARHPINMFTSLVPYKTNYIRDGDLVVKVGDIYYAGTINQK